MKGRILVFTFMIAAIFVTEFALRTDQTSAGTLISPSATPKRSPRPRPTTSLTPKKVKTYIGGSDDGSSIRPASAGSNTAPTQSAPTSINRRRPRNQDIEVENDETHWVGHDRTRRVRTTNNSTANRSKPKKTRTETVDINESITVAGTRTSVSPPRNQSGQRPSGNGKPKQKNKNRRSTVPKPKN